MIFIIIDSIISFLDQLQKKLITFFGDLMPVGIVEIPVKVRQRMYFSREVRVISLKEDIVHVLYVPAVELDQLAYLTKYSSYIVVWVTPQEDVIGVVRFGVEGVVEICMCSEFLLAAVATDRPDAVVLCC